MAWDKQDYSEQNSVVAGFRDSKPPGEISP